MRIRYARLPVCWLHWPWLAMKSDKDWRKYVTDYCNDPKNIRYESYRSSWLSVRKKMKKLVYERDKHECRYCGSENHLQIDHIHPMARGGTNDLDNLQILCRKCNLRKSDKVNYG